MASFFAYPLNYGGARSQYPEVADNDYNTFTSQTSFLLNIDSAGDGSGDARAFTDIFVKGKGIASYTAAFTDAENITSPANRTIPQMVTNDSNDPTSINVDGFQNDLYRIWGAATDFGSADESLFGVKPKAKAITLTFTAATAQTPRIYEVMVLDRLLTINSDGRFSRIEYDSLDLGINDPDLRGRLSYVPPIGGERDKWICNLTLYNPRSVGVPVPDPLAEQLIYFIRRYKQFVFAAEYNRYPERVFPALWNDPRTAIRYLNRWKGGGRRVSFAVREA